MEQTNIHKTLSQLRRLTKYGMSCICLLMTLHCGLLYFGYDAFTVHLLFWFFVMLMGLKLSQIFGLCWVHKLSVIYSMSVIFCIALRTRHIFDLVGIELKTARLIMFLIGIIMCGLNIWKTTDNSSLKSC